MQTVTANIKMDKRLLIFSILYTGLTVYFFYDIQQDQSASIAYLFIFPAFWVITGGFLGLTMWLGKIKVDNTWNILGLTFSTPGPTWLFIFLWTFWPGKDSPASTYEHNDNGHRIREITYQRSTSDLTPKRKEYWKSIDSISAENPFPATDNYSLDSIIYFDKSGNIENKEIYKDGQLIK